MVAVRVWDLPTRLFHWSLATAVVAAVITAKIGGNAMAWHFRIGYVIFTLLLFRLVWGVVGGHWSRFASFIYKPSTLLRYLRGQTRSDETLDVGHNPLGSLSVFGLLGLLVLQVGTGLFADDEIASSGPLNRFVSSATASLATEWHSEFGQFIVLALVGLHVAAILFYLLARRKNLVQAMVGGDKQLPAGTPSARDGLPQRLIAVVLIGVCAAAVTWVVNLGG